MNLLQKLLEIQKEIDCFVKDNTIGEGRSSYKAVGSEQVLDIVRPLMNQFNLLLEPQVISAKVSQDKTSSGTTRYFTEIDMLMTWVDVDSGESRSLKWYGQGTDLAGEKGVGKANTYAEKYFFMKYFHVPTPKDDPDGDSRNKKGELKVKGTQAEKELLERNKKAIEQMVNELCAGDTEKTKQTMIAFTKNDARQYAGVDNISKVSELAISTLYGKVKKTYEQKTGKIFELIQE